MSMDSDLDDNESIGDSEVFDEAEEIGDDDDDSDEDAEGYPEESSEVVYEDVPVRERTHVAIRTSESRGNLVVDDRLTRDETLNLLNVFLR